MRRPRPAIIVTALSALVLVSVPIGVAVAGSGASPVIVESLGSRSESTTTTPPVPRATTVAESAGITRVVPTVEVQQPGPVRLTIPNLDVAADVDLVGVHSDGWVEIPEDVSRVGWYKFGAAPGAATGSAVIVGHRDGFDAGAGALYRLSELAPGDLIEVEREDGSVLSYAVTSREAIDKDALPSEELFSEKGEPRLTLISCIGYFDRDRGGYMQNIVVTATPIDESPRTPAGL
jgi:LPXTG-site transpeptidase (sortase) family protein